MVVYLKVLKILHEPFSFRQNLQKIWLQQPIMMMKIKNHQPGGTDKEDFDTIVVFVCECRHSGGGASIAYFVNNSIDCWISWKIDESEQDYDMMPGVTTDTQCWIHQNFQTFFARPQKNQKSCAQVQIDLQRVVHHGRGWDNAFWPV